MHVEVEKVFLNPQTGYSLISNYFPYGSTVWAAVVKCSHIIVQNQPTPQVEFSTETVD